MASGIDLRVIAVKETVFGTRATPTRTFEVTDDNLDFTYNFYESQGLGGGPWRKRRVQTTRSGGGTLPMEVPTAGFNFWLDLLHPNAVTPVQQSATTAYLSTHSLSGAPTKSATIQMQRPPVGTGALLPFDYLGCMVPSCSFAWEPAGVLTFEPTIVCQDISTAQSLATYTAPTSSDLFSFKGGAITIGGTTVADVIGGGNVNFAFPMRTDAFPLGSSGTMSKPIANDRPAATGSLTADFTDMVHFNRVVNNTIATVVLTFTGALINASYSETLTITIPDCGFTNPAPQVSGPGPVQQTIQFNNASSAGTAPTITDMSTDSVV